ncbi:uncharacterized protein PGTG_02915 [Puccinia graminis f. sp. tritici CRL 75-36-700-3]|uniref:Uncharacterized protein n=1 Tax=Puccinia graminis f. sp. tritici (strain CRL 75-36-700-3 / race SCCL) TaxID=418459 RepID=E3JWP9_PUCGT|nr:uncharacterized protein PGTG_02915 [Puccinia graminis f. sp. tritici CRL 75-36-700-3]EFP76474.2 hypothetical protein PGTG_02915 [Puccinia graminis f. sp. tritici CRL 75-36-700-3]
MLTGTGKSTVDLDRHQLCHEKRKPNTGYSSVSVAVAEDRLLYDHSRGLSRPPEAQGLSELTNAGPGPAGLVVGNVPSLSNEGTVISQQKRGEGAIVEVTCSKRRARLQKPHCKVRMQVGRVDPSGTRDPAGHGAGLDMYWVKSNPARE